MPLLPHPEGCRAYARASLASVLFQEPANSSAHPFCVASFTAPDDQDFPSEGPQPRCIRRVPRDVAGELWSPVSRVGFWRAGIETFCFWVHVPEAAVHEDHLAARPEHEVRFSRQVAAVQAITIAEGVDEAANGKFGGSIFRTYRRHVGRAAGGGEGVGQTHTFATRTATNSSRASAIRRRFASFES